MSVIIEISEDGCIEATHNSGEEIWSTSVDPSVYSDEDAVDIRIAEDLAPVVPLLPSIRDGSLQMRYTQE